MMNIENAPKEIVQSFIDLVSMGKGLMNENQQSSVTQELGRFFPSIISGGRRGESSELLKVNAGESSASATDTNNINFTIRSTTKRMIEEIWGSKATSKKPRKSMSHKTTSGKTPRKFAILFHVKHEFRLGTWFMVFLKSDLPRLYFEVCHTKSELFWAISVSSKRNTKEDFELVLLRQTCQINHVLNYASGIGLGTIRRPLRHVSAVLL